jgi:kynurenine formamidase
MGGLPRTQDYPTPGPGGGCAVKPSPPVGHFPRDVAGPAPPHSTLLAAGIPIVEHLRGLDALPETGFRFSAPPPMIAGLGSFPVRAYAIVDVPAGQ